MVDFRKMVRPGVQKRLRREEAELAKLHALDDSALARAVLELSRQVRSIRSDKVEMPFLTYTTALLHQVIPFLAKKMDPSIELEQIEIDAIAAARPDRLNDMVAMAPEKLRDYVGVMIDNSSVTYGITWEQAHEDPVRLLDRPIELGNPVALLVDRISPAPVGVDRVERPGNGPARYPAWSPPAARDPLPGFWLMVSLPNGDEDIVAYHETRGEADIALADVADKGLPREHRLLHKSSYAQLEENVLVRFDLRNWDDEVVSPVLEAPLKREEPEADDSVLEP